VLTLHVRLQDGATLDDRLRELRASTAFDALRVERGAAAVDEMFARRVRLIAGDIARPELGLASPKEAMADVDLVVHSAALTTFELPLDAALRSNVLAAREALGLARRMKRPALLHVSTCYVAGLRRGTVLESERPRGYLPAASATDAPFDARAELAAAEAAVKRIEEESADLLWRRTFEKAMAGRSAARAPSPAVRRSLVELERKRWLRSRLSEEAARRARTLGWPNAYAYSKSLAEQLLESESEGVALSILRTSIIGPAGSRPSPGWFHGYNPLSPLAFLAARRQALLPGDPALVFDLIPVDLAAGGLLLVAAALLAGRAAPVHQLGTSATNPVTLGRVLELFELAALRKSSPGEATVRARFERLFASSGAVSRNQYRAWGAPMLGALARRGQEALRGESMLPAPWRAAWSEGLRRVAELASRGESVIGGFEPFLGEMDLRFDCALTLALRDALPPRDRAALAFEPERLDWRAWLLDACAPSLLEATEAA
jgi:long-chain acyl-CoA synthetase